MKPLLLAIDTTHECGSIAIARGDEILEEVALRAPDGFAHVLFGQLAALLQRHGIQPCEVDCFASASGPGSFTGVRVGLACVKGLAETCCKPAVAVSNLQALASFGSRPLRATVLDARRDEVYGGVYNCAGEAMAPEMVAKLSAWLETLPPGVEFVTQDFRPELAGTRFAAAPVVAAPHALAGAIARIAAGRLLRGEASDAAALDANYVRRSDAELFWKE